MLTKLARRCTPTSSVDIHKAKEEIRSVFVMEQLTQQLPKNIQTYIRERRPSSLEDVLSLIQTYFKAHRLDERKWETRNYSKPSGSKQPGTNHNNDNRQPSHNKTPHDKTGGYPHQQGKPPAPPQQQRQEDKFQSKTYSLPPKKDMSQVKCSICSKFGHYASQCVKVNLVSLPGSSTTPPVMKPGKIGEAPHLWYMDSGADFCFIAEDLLPPGYNDGPPVHATGALSETGKNYPTAVFPAEIEGKKSLMCAAVIPRHCLPYPAIVGRSGSGLHISWDAKVTQPTQTPTESLQTSPNPDQQLDTDLDLDQLTSPAQILAVKTRAQKKREQQLQQADQEATQASGAVIHTLPSGETRTGSANAQVDQPPPSLPPEVEMPSKEEGSDDDERVTITPDPFTRADLIKGQQEDVSLKPLFQEARQGSQQLAIKDDVLYAVDLNAKPDDNPWKLVVPTNLRKKILDLGHNRIGHVGHKKTRRMILDHFYWPGISKDIQKHCQGCKQCLAYNAHRKDTQPQQIVPVITRPWAKLAMDVVGPLTTTKSGYRYLLTVIDLATQWLFL